MISIRECIDESELFRIKNKHVAFVCEEIKKRIEFYINLFNNLNYLKSFPRTHANTIELRIKKIKLHHKQYLPFIKPIFQDDNFSGNYNELKKNCNLKTEAKDIDNVITILKKLKKRSKIIVGLDLTVDSLRNGKYYELSKTYYNPIDFILKKIFDYEEWFEKLTPDDDWGPYQLTQELGIKVCCYCNRQYTFSLTKGKVKITRPELDHFLPKYDNPLLALSFFNLIPSCTICNRDCKGKTKFSYSEYFSPYESNPKHRLFSFDYIPTSYLGSVGESPEIKVFIKNKGVKLEPNLMNRLNANIKIFQYNLIINEHRDIVQDIIKKRYMSNDSYIESLQNAFPRAKLTTNEAYRLAYGNFYEEKEFSKRPLAKLTKDMAISIGILKKYNK